MLVKPTPMDSAEQHKADAPACAITVSVVFQVLKDPSWRFVFETVTRTKLTNQSFFVINLSSLLAKTRVYRDYPATSKKRRVLDKVCSKTPTPMGTTERDQVDTLPMDTFR